MALKSLVNAVAEMLGVEAADELLLVVDVELDELEDELPHAAMPRLAQIASAAIKGLLFSKVTLSSS
jgi:hypothetical protein